MKENEMLDGRSALTNADDQKMAMEFQTMSLDANEIADQVDEHIEKVKNFANDSKKRNEGPPKARPRRNRQETTVEKYSVQQEMEMCTLKQRNQSPYQNQFWNTFVTVITGLYLALTKISYALLRLFLVVFSEMGRRKEK